MNRYFVKSRYIADGAPPASYDQDAAFEGGTAGGCLYNVSPDPHVSHQAFAHLIRLPNPLAQADGTIQDDRNAGFCPQTAVSCTVAKRDFAARRLAARRPSPKMIRSEMSDALVAKRGVWNQKKRA